MIIAINLPNHPGQYYPVNVARSAAVKTRQRSKTWDYCLLFTSQSQHSTGGNLMLAYINVIRRQNSKKLYVWVQGQAMLLGSYLSYLLKKLSVKGGKVRVVGSGCSSNNFTEYYVCNFLDSKTDKNFKFKLQSQFLITPYQWHRKAVKYNFADRWNAPLLLRKRRSPHCGWTP